MQNRRILNRLFTAHQVEARPPIETNSVLTLWSHVQSGKWSSILPQAFLPLFGQGSGVRSVPMEESGTVQTIGIVVPDREPLTPSARELARLAETLDLGAALEHGPRVGQATA